MDRTDRIVPLDELSDFKVAEGDPDVRGWEVLSSDGSKIGDVDNLLVDSTAMKVRYLDVDLDESNITDGSNRHILVPIGFARLDEGADQIFVDSLNPGNLGEIPAYRHEPLTREYETTLRKYFDTGYTGSEEDFYADDLYDEDRFFRGREGEARMTRSEEELAVGRREHQMGELDLEKHVETEHVSEHVPTHHEEVIVERHPAAMSTDARIEDEEIRIPVSEEELVVEKRAVPKEEIVVRKEDRVRDETVEADLRRERVDLRRQGDVDVREEEEDR
ncbi:MAG: DUF2382 domain-containing protein [Gemmatimonas sp.]|nr:DUF2382 domain-containing protein [Gemmatimonas sp.]